LVEGLSDQVSENYYEDTLIINGSLFQTEVALAH
jgi:hypothetical protein